MMRPQVARALLTLAAYGPSGIFIPPPIDVAERRLERQVAKLVTTLYAEEREAAPWIDLGGEG